MTNPTDWPLARKTSMPVGNGVDVWAWRVDEPSPYMVDVIAAAEHIVFDQIVSLQAKSARIAARAGLRLLLGSYLDCNCRDIHFATSELGKPSLLRPDNSGLHFNVTHSGEWVMAAVSRQPVGIDVEVARPLSHLDGMARRVLSGEELARWRALAELSQRTAEFFRTWVQKEAVTKLDGRGLQLPMTSIALSDSHATWPSGECRVHMLCDGPELMGAIATPTGDESEGKPDIECFRLQVSD